MKDEPVLWFKEVLLACIFLIIRNKFCVQFYSFENLYFFGQMDNLDKIAIRFHVDGSLLYVGGDIAKSWIDEDKLSFFELGLLADQFNSASILRMYWLKPGINLSSGLVLLVDDASCQVMVS